MTTPVAWAAQIEHVREVTLHGTADLAFWKRQLPENLHPAASDDGQAQLLIIAADLTFKGIRFRELSFSVQVCPPEQANKQDAAYLVQAFNSARFFAWYERAFFATPYDHGDVQVTAVLPAAIQLARQGQLLFGATMGAAGPARAPVQHKQEQWEGPIFLPQRRRAQGRPNKLFVARISGDTQRYAFLPGQDTVTLRPAPEGGIVQALLDSKFVAKEWAIRTDATHAKSKTYQLVVQPSECYTPAGEKEARRT